MLKTKSGFRSCPDSAVIILYWCHSMHVTYDVRRGIYRVKTIFRVILGAVVYRCMQTWSSPTRDIRFLALDSVAAIKHFSIIIMCTSLIIPKHLMDPFLAHIFWLAYFCSYFQFSLSFCAFFTLAPILHCNHYAGLGFITGRITSVLCSGSILLYETQPPGRC